MKETEPDRSKRRRLLAVLAIGWGEQEPEKAIENVLEHYDDEAQAKRDAVGNILTRLRRRDLKLAAELVKKLPPSVWRSEEIADTASEWPTTDLETFREWASSFDLIEDRAAAYARFAQQFSKSSIEEVESAIIAIDEPTFTRAVVGHKSDHLAMEGDPHLALAWADEHGVDATRSVIQMWARVAPEEAAAHVGALVDPVKMRDLSHWVRNEYSRHDPETACVWAASMGDRLGNHKLVRDAVSGWMYGDSMRASQWVRDLEAGPAKDQAIHAIISYLDGKEAPETIDAWINQIEDAELQSRVRNEVRNDPINDRKQIDN